jgi:methionyl-tRNA formyltransferase
MPSVILLGSKPGAAVILGKMLKANWSVQAIVIPSKYDQSWMPRPTLIEIANENSIPVFSNQTDVNFENVDYVISYMYRHLVKDAMIKKARVAAVNFHPAPLPRFGGFAFYNVAILEGSKQYGCTCHHMDASFDTGNIVKVRTFEIDPDVETALTLERRTQAEMLLLFDDFMSMAESKYALPSTPQSPSEQRYMTRIEFEKLKVISNLAKKEEIQRTARAFWFPPYECAYMLSGNGDKIQVLPDLVLRDLGLLLHRNDFAALMENVNGLKFGC